MQRIDTEKTSARGPVWKRVASELKAPDTEIRCKIADQCGLCRDINFDPKKAYQEKMRRLHETLATHATVSNSCKTLSTKPTSTPLGYRTHAKYRFRFSSQDQKIAWQFVREHLSPPDTRDCPLHHASLRRLVRDIDRYLCRTDHFANAKDLFAGVIMRVGYLTEEAMVTFVVKSDATPFIKALVYDLNLAGHRVISTYQTFAPLDTSGVFDEEPKLVTGVQRLRVSLCGLHFSTTPSSHFPVNPWMAEKIYRRIEQLAGDQGQQSTQRVAWSLYSSVGIGALILARRGYLVFGADRNAQAIRNAQDNALSNDLQDKVYFLSSAIEDLSGTIPTWAWTPSLIYVKAPRGGMSREAALFLSEILQKNPDVIILLHAKDLLGLTKILDILRDFGGLPRQIEAFDVFPFTKNFEYLCPVSFSKSFRK